MKLWIPDPNEIYVQIYCQKEKYHSTRKIKTTQTDVQDEDHSL